MADLYTKLQGVAAGILVQYNQAVVGYIAVTAAPGPKHDPGTPIEATPVRLPGAVAKGVPAKYIEAKLALEGDLIVTAGVVAGVTVNVGDKIVIAPKGTAFADILTAGTKWRIVKDLMTPAIGTPVVFKFVVRK